MNIAILIHGFPPHVEGGAENQAANFAKHLAKKHNVIVYTRHFGGRYTEERDGYSIRRIKLINIPISRFLSDVFFTLSKIRKNKKNIDLIISFMFVPSGIIGVIAKKIFKIPLITAIRNENEYLTKNFVKRKIVNSCIIKNSNVVWVQSETIKKNFLRVYPNNKTVVISNGIDVSSQKAKGNNLIYVGRLLKRKGVTNLISALKQLSGEKLIVVGDGPERRELEEKSRNLNVEFVGKVPSQRVKDYLRQANILILPALHSEGFPNVVIEAMSVGVPVVATTVGAVPDIIKHGKTGFLVEPGNVNDLTKYIKLLCENEKLRDKLSKNCLKEVKKYGWDTIMGNLNKIIERIK